jgi:hypothetical protein
LGNALQLREQARDAWGWTWIDRFAQDLRYAARMLRKSPGFTLAAVLMLAIGIGVNVAVFGFFDLMVLRPLNVRDPATLLRFHRRSPQNYAFAMPYPEMAFFRDHSRTLSAVLALNTTKVAVEGEDKQIDANFVTANFFSELGATPRLGRLLDPARDEAPGAPRRGPGSRLLAAAFRRRSAGDRPDHPPERQARYRRRRGRRRIQRTQFEPVGHVGALTQQPYFATGSLLLTDFAANSVRMWGRLQPGSRPKRPRRNSSRWRRSCANSIPPRSGRRRRSPAIPAATPRA